ncbi:AarF/ABC1/UbiB kinase family protein [Mycolicibacterium mucogenicum]|uniref:ABC1 kinase family protein n=1 Tax=Mycolicibacterium mucogenicum TaxID=56689 RepID=UPI00226A39A6|nr:AarF/ABC1/UbiB kinase family protein [Mycolicibacterium mucogenicum]MCX8553811.1 AarF/ABC1/UbiB kinase family protein [Mycolicibacterium mucogenicum]
MYAAVPMMAPELVACIVETDLGLPAAELFAEFEYAPIAFGSIGQVHRAVLHDGRAVAVKIQYPGVADVIRADMSNPELVVSIWRYLQAAARMKMPNSREIANEIAARIAEQIDYRHEAANITAFSRLFAGHPYLRIPEVIDGRCGERVLTMTYLDGLNLEQARQADQDLRDSWAEAIYRFFCGSYRHGSLFHGDPHPDNLRFGTDGSIGIVDFGCVQTLSEFRRRHFAALPRAAMSGTKQDIARAMIEAGFVWSNPDVTPDDLHRWWQPLLSPLVNEQPVQFGGPDFLDLARMMLLMHDHPQLGDMHVPSEHMFAGRLSVSFMSTLVALGARFHARGCIDDMDGVAEPITDMGRQHIAWVRRRGLPFGLDDHTARPS